MSQRIYLNDHWFYAPRNSDDIMEVRIPHTNVELPYQYFDEKSYQFVSNYSRTIYAEESWKGKHVFITFEGVAHVAKVYLGEQLIGSHYGGYTSFTFDLGPYLRYGMENNIIVEVDSRETSNVPPFGHVIDYLTYGGIYRDVYLEIKEEIYIEDIFPRVAHGDVERKSLWIDVCIAGETEIDTIKLAYYLRKKEEEEWVTLEENKGIEEFYSTAEFLVESIELWDLEQPNLYDIKVVVSKEDEHIDEKVVRFGYRTCEFKVDGFYLNGEKKKLLGLNRHQSFAYVGYAMPKRPQIQDANIIKYELGLNAVRTSHYPQSHHFINRCDELGILVFTEIPGWQHIGDDLWQKRAIQHAEEMVNQYRNHPSIILWGARINESMDDDEFYKKTNRIIRSLDDSRQTGGVRYIKNSHLLEDVYTYNDFSHTGNNAGVQPKSAVTKESAAPYLVTEYNGHMYPTKPSDDEPHRLSHAKRHARVLDGIFQNEEITGGFGWCMFDYNTHKDFGSGDHICYHGVMNMFRMPKLAASVYGSQGCQEPILEISSTMDKGEHPGGTIASIYAFTNADSVKLYKNQVLVSTFYPDKVAYPHLPHPPILIDDFIGELMEKEEGMSHENATLLKGIFHGIGKYGQHNLPIKYKLMAMKLLWFKKISIEQATALYYKYVSNWGSESITYRFEAIKDDSVVKVVEKSCAKKVRLKVQVDSYNLKEEETYDVASVRIYPVDENNQIVPYYQGVVYLSVTDRLELIGPNMISLTGGGFGTYVKTKGKIGTGKLQIVGPDLDPVEVVFHIEKTRENKNNKRD